jgi:hypothetical protein
MLECDYNVHKSNSTYFTDLDMSRGNLGLIILQKKWNLIPGPKHFVTVLSGAQCVWRKEIKPYERYELWTRLLSWDEKWVYTISHFVKPGFTPDEFVLQPGKKPSSRKKDSKITPEKAVFASSVARFVIKNNRKTVPPEQGLRECGMLPTDELELAEVERLRLKYLPIGQLRAGWDEIHGAFQPGSQALGFYTDL